MLLLGVSVVGVSEQGNTGAAKVSTRKPSKAALVQTALFQPCCFALAIPRTGEHHELAHVALLRPRLIQELRADGTAMLPVWGGRLVRGAVAASGARGGPAGMAAMFQPAAEKK